MKHLLYKTFLTFIIITVVCSCAKKTPPLQLLEQAQQLSMFYPEEALAKLDSIEKPEELDTDSYMQFILTRTEAHFRIDRENLKNDTLIYKAQKYFTENKNLEKAALASLYSGLLAYHHEDKIDKALNSFFMAKDYAAHIKDTLLITRCLNNIAYMYYEANILDSAAVYYEKTLDYLYQFDSPDDFKLITLRFMGNTQRRLKNYEASETYFKDGIEIFNNTNSDYYDILLKHDLGILYIEMDKISDAYPLIKEVIPSIDNITDSLIAFTNMASIFHIENQLDSSNYYINLVETKVNESKNKELLSYAYFHLAKHYKKIKDFQTALYYSELEAKVDRIIAEEKQAQKIYEVNFKRYMERKQQEFDSIAKQQTIIMIVSLVLITAIIGGAVYGFLYIRRHFNRRLQEIDSLRMYYKQSIQNLMQLHSSYSDMIGGMKLIESEVKVLESQNFSQIEISEKTKTLRNDLHNKTNEQLIRWAKDFLKIQPSGEEISAQLHDDGILFLTLCAYGYSDQEIAVIAEMPEEDVKPIKMEMKKMLEEQGLGEKDIEDMLYGQDIFKGL